MANLIVHPKTGIYQFRKVVPPKLRSKIGKREVKKSLETRDLAEARRRHAILSAELEQSWAKLKAEPEQSSADPTVIQLTGEQVVALSGDIYRALLRQHGEDPGSAKTW